MKISSTDGFAFDPVIVGQVAADTKPVDVEHAIRFMATSKTAF